MAHRFEFAVKNAVDYVNGVSHFRCLTDELYKVYSLSPKKQSELSAIASENGANLLKVQKKTFDVRWVFSSFTAVKAVLRNYQALHNVQLYILYNVQMIQVGQVRNAVNILVF